MKIIDILSEGRRGNHENVSDELEAAVNKLYNEFNKEQAYMSDGDADKWDPLADKLDMALEDGNIPEAEQYLSRLDDLLGNRVGECEEIWVDDNNEILNEAAQRAFKRVGKTITRKYRCTTGMKKGKIVANPISCATRKDPRKVRHGRKIARTKKGIRIRKSSIMKRTAMSKMVTKMNKRLSGRKTTNKPTQKSATKKASKTK